MDHVEKIISLIQTQNKELSDLKIEINSALSVQDIKLNNIVNSIDTINKYKLKEIEDKVESHNLACPYIKEKESNEKEKAKLEKDISEINKDLKNIHSVIDPIVWIFKSKTRLQVFIYGTLVALVIQGFATYKIIKFANEKMSKMDEPRTELNNNPKTNELNNSTFSYK